MTNIAPPQPPPDPARAAAVEAVLPQVEPGMTISLGSGRAVFALAEAIGQRWPDGVPLTAVVASSKTASFAEKAGIPAISLASGVSIDLAIDGADEVDTEFRLIKGGGAALLQEKLVLALAKRTVIIAEAAKYVERVGTNWKLPVEVVRFGWDTTRDRLAQFSDDITPRLNDDGSFLVTDEGHYILDLRIPINFSLENLARDIKLSLGVVEHGLFLTQATQVILGNPDGTATVLNRNLRGQ